MDILTQRFTASMLRRTTAGIRAGNGSCDDSNQEQDGITVRITISMDTAVTLSRQDGGKPQQSSRRVGGGEDVDDDLGNDRSS